MKERDYLVAVFIRCELYAHEELISFTGED